MAVHSFFTEDADKYGIEEAIVLKNIGFWCGHNLANRHNIKDGRVWTYNTRDAFLEQFPYMVKGKDIKAKRVKMGRILKSLEDQGAIVSEQLNKSNYDRTKWYSLADIETLPKYHEVSPQALKLLKEQICSFGGTELFLQENESVPSSTDNKQQIEILSNNPGEQSSRDNGFNVEDCLIFVLSILRKQGIYNIDDVIEAAFIEEKIKEFTCNYPRSRSNAEALSFVEVGLINRHSVKRGNMIVGEARDNRTRAQAATANDQAEKINQARDYDRFDREWDGEGETVVDDETPMKGSYFPAEEVV